MNKDEDNTNVLKKKSNKSEFRHLNGWNAAAASELLNYQTEKNDQTDDEEEENYQLNQRRKAFRARF